MDLKYATQCVTFIRHQCKSILTDWTIVEDATIYWGGYGDILGDKSVHIMLYKSCPKKWCVYLWAHWYMKNYQVEYPTKIAQFLPTIGFQYEVSCPLPF